MSDSDDTDVLLLIPPDFFLVHSSDSEDSVTSEVQEHYSGNCGIEKLVVNDLISHVNELENRVCVIENKSVDLPRNIWDAGYLHQFFDCATSLDSSNCHYLRQKNLTLKRQSMLSTRYRLGESSDILRAHQVINNCSRSLHSTPVKPKQTQLDASVSCTPSRSSSTRQDAGSSTPSKSAISIEPMTPSEILSMYHTMGTSIAPTNSMDSVNIIQHPMNNGKLNQIQQESTLIGEIDEFLDSVKKNPRNQAHLNVSVQSKVENAYNCGEYSTSVPDRGFGLGHFDHLPVKEEMCESKYVIPLEKERRPVKHLEPHEVDQLLRGIEKDGVKDGKHPVLKAVQMELPQQRNMHTCGDDVGSVPDLSFGLHSLNTLPVVEETIKRTTLLPLEAQTVDAAEMKGLELLDIEKLLKQMEATQHEIEKKLQLREAMLERNNTHSEKNLVAAPQNMSLAGDTIGSVPDRGFGIRGIFNSSKPLSKNSYATSKNDTRVPVCEETVTRRNISLLGSENTVDKSQWPQEHSNVEHPTDNLDIFKSAGGDSETNEGTQVSSSNYPEKYLSGQEDKVSVVRRKLELGDNASAIPDCGFGLRSWYQNSQHNRTLEKDKDECSQSFSNSRHIPHFAADDVIPSNPTVTRSVVPSVSKDSYVQGDYLPSVPDLGFDLRSLWTSEASQGLARNATSYSSELSHPFAQTNILRNGTNNDLNSVELSLLSQIQPRETIDETDHSKTSDKYLEQWVGNQETDIHTQIQNSSTNEVQRGSTVQDASEKKKVDFTVGADRGDVILQQEQGAHKDATEGIGRRCEYINSFPHSGQSSRVNNLLSLSELWDINTSSTSQVGSGHAKILLKLEEEKYRRQHCERLIHQLQIRLLEEQQKLAVAVRVDKSKDQAILQLQDAWNRLVQHWKELEEQRHNLASRLQAEREANKKQETKTAQKLRQVESELSKASELSQRYKEKFEFVEKEKLDLIQNRDNEVKKLLDRIQKEEQNLEKSNQLNFQLVQEKDNFLTKVKQSEEEAQTERKLLIDTQRELQNTHKKLDSFEAELSAVKEEKETVQLKLKEEKGRTAILDQQKKSLQMTLDENKKKEKSLREEIKQLTVQSEKIKVELREYYQEQLEVVVRDKLREFQEQLDAAESSLHKELEQREHAITDMASKQVKQISEKHQLEIQLLEEKHREELHLNKLHLAQAMQQITQLESKLQGYNSRKSEIVEKLHNVMETQWQEALRIVSGNSPLVNHMPEHMKLQRREIDTGTWPLATQNHPMSAGRSGQFQSMKIHGTDNLQSGRSDVDSRTNEEKVTKFNKAGNDSQSAFKDFLGMSQPHMPTIHLHQQSNGSSTADEMPFSQEGQLTYRMAEQPLTFDERISSKRHTKIENQNDELKKYIVMLLDRTPGNPLDEENEISNDRQNSHDEKKQGFVDVPTNEGSENPKWEKILQLGNQVCLSSSQSQNVLSNCDLSKAGHGSVRDGRHLKPPWK